MSRIDTADTVKAKNTKSSKSFGKTTSDIVCGDKLCSEILQNISKYNAKLISTVSSVSLLDGDQFNLTASQITKDIDGKTLQMFGYNGQTPDPSLLVSQGDEIIVTFANELDFPITVHWHGLSLVCASDGVPGISQEPILPGEIVDILVEFSNLGNWAIHCHILEHVESGMITEIVVR